MHSVAKVDLTFRLKLPTHPPPMSTPHHAAHSPLQADVGRDADEGHDAAQDYQRMPEHLAAPIEQPVPARRVNLGGGKACGQDHANCAPHTVAWEAVQGVILRCR